MIKIKRLFKSFQYALRGFARVMSEEQNLRVQSAVGALVIFLGAYFRVSRFEWCFLVLAIGFVMLAEIMNSAVERVVDILKPRMDVYIKEIKDIMACAVMFASLVAVIMGVIIFYPYIINI
ncbi:MAG: diacylglycerol kinase family protein, partial [bacterium]